MRSKKGISRVSEFPNFLALASVGRSTFFKAGLFPEIKFEYYVVIMDHLTKERKQITVKHHNLDLSISDQRLSDFQNYIQ